MRILLNSLPKFAQPPFQQVLCYTCFH